MADVLGIASGIAGLVGLTIEIFGISYKYINGVRNASPRARRFLKELEDLQMVLLRVEKFAKETDQWEVFGDSGSCLLSIKQSDEYIGVLEKVRDKLEQQQRGSSFRHAMKALSWTITEKETFFLAESLHRHLKIYETALAADSLTIGKLTLSEVRQLNVSQEGRWGLTLRMQITHFIADKRIEAVLDWLSPLNMYQKQQDVLSRRHGATCSWLLVDPLFQSWVDTGTGKPIISSVVIDHLLNNNASEKTKVAYVYCDYKDQAAQTASNLIACLARQILGRPTTLLQQVKEMYNMFEKEKRRPTFDELTKLLVALCNQSERTYIIIDALDECEAINERRLLLPVLGFQPNASTRLFVTSRPNKEDIFRSFGKASQIPITAPELDLRQYTRERLEARIDLADILTPELKEKIVSTVSTGASGMFLLATLQIDRILASRTVKRIKSALTSMPRELDEIYRQTMERIRNQAGDDGAMGMRILSWIAHARRPLSVDELRYGLAVEYNDDDDEGDLEELDEDNLLTPASLFDVCAGLVIIDPTSQIIRLVHYTTQEYFDKARLHLFRDAEIDLSRACLTYLSYKSVAESVTLPLGLDEAHISHPFMDYAARHWFSHARSGLLLENPAPEFSKAVARLKSSDSIVSWTETLLKPPQYPDPDFYPFYPNSNSCSVLDRDRNARTFPLEIASYLGLEELVAVLLDHGTGSCPGADTSLVFASSMGYLKVVKLLLLHGARVDSTVKNKYIYPGNVTALAVACMVGNLSVAKVLIEKGADIHDQILAATPPMHAAAAFGHTSLPSFLLNEGVDINGRDSIGRTACHLAVKYRFTVDSFKYLLDAHCDLALTDNDGQSALHHAASFLSLRTIQLLLDRGADASAKNRKGQTARNLLEQELSILAPEVFGPEYLELVQQLIQRLLQLEQKSAASVTNGPCGKKPGFSHSPCLTF